MPTTRRPRCAILVPLAVALLLGGCDRDAPRAPDSSSATVRAESLATPPAVTAPAAGWNPDAGVALLVPGDGGEVLVVVPGVTGDSAIDRTAGDAARVLPADVALFSRSGAAGRAAAVLAGAPGAAGCTDAGWPTVRLGAAAGSPADAGTSSGWTVGFVGGRPAALALDSIEAATAADSAGLAATVTRLAGALGDDTLRALRGVPFTVRSARRFALADGATGVVAVLERALNQEAMPLREQILLVAERPRDGTSGAPWITAYHERYAGREEDVMASDVLAAVTLGAAAQPTLVVARALANGNRYTLLERTGERAWRARWTSVLRGC